MTDKKVTKTLNMEEKKKFEKIIFQDIDRAKQALQNSYHEKRNVVEARVMKGSIAVKFLNDYKDTTKKLEAIKKQAEAEGYHIQSWNEPSIGIDSDHKELKDLSRDNRDKEAKLEGMKRTYTLKLFAGGEEAQELFDSLAKELSALTK